MSNNIVVFILFIQKLKYFFFVLLMVSHVSYGWHKVALSDRLSVFNVACIQRQFPCHLYPTLLSFFFLGWLRELTDKKSLFMTLAILSVLLSAITWISVRFFIISDINGLFLLFLKATLLGIFVVVILISKQVNVYETFTPSYSFFVDTLFYFSHIFLIFCRQIRCIEEDQMTKINKGCVKSKKECVDNTSLFKTLT